MPPVTLSHTGATNSFPAPIREYCNMETFNASCPRPNDVIVVRRARYGRMQIGRCVKRNLGYVGCSADVLAILDARCSGRRRCELALPDTELHATHACPEDTTPYLEVAYECLQGRRAAITTYFFIFLSKLILLR